MMGGLLNYTTSIPVEKTVGEIEKMLADSGAQKILKEYDGSGSVTSISFIIDTEKGVLPFRLPMNVRAVMQVINNQSEQYVGKGYSRHRVIPKKMVNDMEQAKRVGWRIIKDWLEAQLALIFLQMVKVEEIFLPYMWNERSGKTVFEMLEEKNFNFKQLENKNE